MTRKVLRHVARLWLASVAAFLLSLAPNQLHASANSLPYYWLPWWAGTSHSVTQGNGGAFSH